MSKLAQIRIGAVLVFILGALISWFILSPGTGEHDQFKYGLDLSGGAHLVYSADTSSLNPTEVDEAMSALRDVVERRINAFGVAEPNVQIEQGGLGSGGEDRLIVELPGITDIDQAVAEIGRTPLLEFKLLGPEVFSTEIDGGDANLTSELTFVDTGLTGRLLQRATLEFGTGSAAGFSNEPVIGVQFNSEGADLFEEITRENSGQILYILLDGEVISDPRINEAIPGGRAVITGNFTPDEARELVRNLNLGALPVPIELVSTQTIGPTLGAEARDAGVRAGVIGLLAVALFLLLWYRLPGLIASISLAIYLSVMLALFKFIPVVLTSAGIAGFVLSIGMAVDANILIFERMKEEFGQHGGRMQEAIRDGFARAWPSIRDGNLSSIFTAIVLYWAGTSLTQGFAVVWGIGIVVSMLSAIVVSRTLLLALGSKKMSGVSAFLYGIGFKNATRNDS